MLLRRVWFVLALAALLTAGASAADVVVPSDRVSLGVNIRAQSDGDSEILGLLRPGEQLPHLGSVPRWHEVQLSGGRTGFVSSSWTEVIHDDDGPPPVAGGGTPPPVVAPPPTESTTGGTFDFWLSEALVQKLASRNTIMFSMQLTLTARSNLHSLSSDCELHIAGTPVDPEDLAAPPSFVVEPPNLCKNPPPGGGSWTDLVTTQLLGRTCTVMGFPRIYDEHLVGDETPTNPHHMLEIHPALKIDCPGGGSLDATGFLAYHPGMSEIQPSSAAKCFDTRLWVRRNAAEQRYEFRAQRSRNCGNFASFEYSIFDEWIRTLPNGGHSALIRVRPEGMPNRTLKIYTYPGTEIDDTIVAFDQSDEAQQGGVVHGMLTFDYFAIVKAVRDRNGTLLPVAEWTEVPFPLALVAFGPKPDTDPDEHE